METARVLTIPALFGALALLVTAAHVGGYVATRARLPNVVGELGAGIALSALPIGFIHGLQGDALLHACAELGVLLLMFDIGLELRTSDLRRIGLRAVGVATLGVVASLVLVAAGSLAVAASPSLWGHVFIGATLAATSMGVAGRVLREFGKTQSAEGRMVLAAAVMDDVMSLVVLAFVSAFAGVKGEAQPGHGVAGIILRALGFLVAAVVFGRVALPKLFALAARVAGDGALLVFGLAICLGYGWAADRAGLSPMIGAFCAGLVIQPEDYRPLVKKPGDALEDMLGPLLTFLVPFFFLLAGLKVDVAAFGEPRAWLLSAVVMVAAVAGKLAAGLGAGPQVSRRVVGVAMVPRGEVTLIFATAGAALETAAGPLVPKSTFNAIVITVIATALVPPIALRRLFAAAAPASRRS